MTQRDALLRRLDDIGRSLAQRPTALALIGLGSVGRDLDRLDDYSDLDFFVIVESDHKPDYLADLSWLAAAHPLAFAFRNSDAGHKFLYADGIYGEMAVFGPEELATAAYAPGRMVWRRDGVDEAWAAPPNWPPARTMRPADWLVNEALTNLYVGLGRYHRGEKLSALRFIQGYALDRIVELAGFLESPQPGFEDPFNRERRFEARFPQTAAVLASLLPGYDATPAAARAILQFLAARFPVNPALKAAIERLCA